MYTYIKTPSEAAVLNSHLMSSATRISFDTETTGLDPHKDKVVLASLATDTNVYVLDCRDADVLRAIAPTLENEAIKKALHNGGFDYKMVKGTAGCDIEGIFDTMLAEYSLTAGTQFDGYGLDAVSKKYLGTDVDKTLQKSFIGHKGDFSQAQLDYAANDAKALLPLIDEMQKKMKSEGVLRAWITESKAVQAFADIEYYGQKIDAAAWKVVMDDNRDAALVAKKQLDVYFENVYGRDLFGDVFVNYDSNPVVLYGLQMLGVKADGEMIRDTNKKTQRKIKQYPVVQALQAYRAAQKRLGTYGQQYLDAIHPVTGRVHFRFNQYGTETGRPAAVGGLNCLNIPREKRYRNAFITDEDRLLGTVDYSGAELRIAADLSGDPLMVSGFNSGEDFHCYVASILFGVPVTKKNENKHLRDPAKAINFGLFYGLGVNSLYEDLVGNGVKITAQETKDMYYGYKRTFKTCIEWLEAKQSEASTLFEAINIVGRKRRWFKPQPDKLRIEVVAELCKKKKCVESALGDYEIAGVVNEMVKARLAGISREGANFHIQSVNAEMTKAAMYRIRKECKQRKYDARMYNSVYDEIVLDIKKTDSEAVFALQCKIMKEEANKLLRYVSMEVEGHLASCWTK